MHTTYQPPLSTRYASSAMSHIFSAQFKHSTWRRLWVALAKAEMALGLPITMEQIEELAAHIEDIDFNVAGEFEKKLQHDVMAHIHAYGEQCPLARSIIHLGATSCYVTDNTDLIQMREALYLLIGKLEVVIRQLAHFAEKYANQACLGFTHFQSAQPTTVGKRACLWIQDLVMDLQELKIRLNNLRFLGVKGTTGTQASFFTLFDQDHEKVKALDHLVAKEMGFQNLFIISGQTYTRKQDVLILNALAGVAISAHKFATDLRLLSHLKEVEEPFKEDQIGSSAMPYKRNPILSERVCSIARFVISLSENPSYTASTQWLERSLDDSANRRMCIAEAFLGCDSLLILLEQISKDLKVNSKVIEKHLSEELPFMATENILMAAVKKGGDRQDLHEKIRKYSRIATEKINNGESHHLLKDIMEDPAFKLTEKELTQLLNSSQFIGRAPEQVKEFLEQEVRLFL